MTPATRRRSASRTSSRRSSSSSASAACRRRSRPAAASSSARSACCIAVVGDAPPQGRSSVTSGSSRARASAAAIGIAISGWIPMTQDARANRALATRSAGSPRRSSASPSTCARADQPRRHLQDGRARVRVVPRLPHLHRQHHGVRQAPGLHHGRARDLEGAELHQHRPLRRLARVPSSSSSSTPQRLSRVFFAICGHGPGARRHGGPADRRRRHAGRHLAAQLVRRPRGVRDGLRARAARSSSSPARSTARRASSCRSS